jgi:hypothetical protein
MVFFPGYLRIEDMKIIYENKIITLFLCDYLVVS